MKTKQIERCQAEVFAKEGGRLRAVILNGKGSNRLYPHTAKHLTGFSLLKPPKTKNDLIALALYIIKNFLCCGVSSLGQPKNPFTSYKFAISDYLDEVKIFARAAEDEEEKIFLIKITKTATVAIFPKIEEFLTDGNIAIQSAAKKALEG